MAKIIINQKEYEDLIDYRDRYLGRGKYSNKTALAKECPVCGTVGGYVGWGYYCHVCHKEFWD